MGRPRKRAKTSAREPRAGHHRHRTKYPVVGARQARSLNGYTGHLQRQGSAQAGEPVPWRPSGYQQPPPTEASLARTRRKFQRRGWEVMEDGLLARLLTLCLPEADCLERNTVWFFRSPVEGVSVRLLLYGVAAELDPHEVEDIGHWLVRFRHLLAEKEDREVWEARAALGALRHPNLDRLAGRRTGRWRR